MKERYLKPARRSATGNIASPRLSPTRDIRDIGSETTSRIRFRLNAWGPGRCPSLRMETYSPLAGVIPVHRLQLWLFTGIPSVKCDGSRYLAWARLHRSTEQKETDKLEMYWL